MTEQKVMKSLVKQDVSWYVTKTKNSKGLFTISYVSHNDKPELRLNSSQVTQKGTRPHIIRVIVYMT